MSRDSKLFVVCKEEDNLKIVKAVLKALTTYSKNQLDAKIYPTYGSRLEYLCSNEYKTSKQFYTHDATLTTKDLETFQISFGSGDEYLRTVWLFTSCSKDYDHIHKGNKVILSTGCCGKYEEIMTNALYALKSFGKVYQDLDDCDDEDFILINKE